MSLIVIGLWLVQFCLTAWELCAVHQDVVELRDFYARPLGITVRRLLTHRLRARWRNVQGETVVGLGFAPPFLGPYRGEAARLGAFMPEVQGALVWPRKGDKHAVLAQESNLPLPDNSVDRLLGVHCLETTEQVRPMLREIWRVLAPSGELVLIVANRRSVWARTDTTPFGHGRPYSRGQLDKLLKQAMFSPVNWAYALQMPPLERQIVLRSAVAMERFGSSLLPGMGGVIIVGAKKELLAPTAVGRAAVPTLGRLVTIAGR